MILFVNMRILGLDIGEKRIGVAISDELEIMAHGLRVLTRKGLGESHAKLSEDIKDLKGIIEDCKVEEIIVGLPINMNGTMGDAANRVIEFVRSLKSNISIPVKTWDERLTTSQGEKILISADVSRKKRKKVIDKLAAQILLQSYLDYRKRRNKND